MDNNHIDDPFEYLAGRSCGKSDWLNRYSIDWLNRQCKCVINLEGLNGKWMDIIIKEAEIFKLQNQLNLAIHEERYEDCIPLKKQIEELEEKLRKEAKKKGLGKERSAAYIFGTLRKMGWKPEYQKRHQSRG